jgi:hypothetical protein
MQTAAENGNISLFTMTMVLFSFVLASLHEPMLRDLANKKFRAQTKAQIHSIRTALLSFKSDMRHLPYSGNSPYETESYMAAWEILCNNDSVRNPLVSGSSDHYRQMSSGRWKGPYIESGRNTAALFKDVWGNPIVYYAVADGRVIRVFLHSAGEDGIFDLGRSELNRLNKKIATTQKQETPDYFAISPGPIVDAHSSCYNGDDILVEVDRFRKSSRPGQVFPYS